MKVVLMLLFGILAMASSPCQANSIANNTTTILPNSINLVPGTLPVLKPGEGDGPLIAGLISISAGVVVLITGSIIRYSSSKPKTIHAGTIVQGAGISMIGLPVAFALQSDKYQRRRTRRENRKPRGFKNRHHYY